MLQIGKSEDETLRLQKLAAREMMQIALDHAGRSRAVAQATRIPLQAAHRPIAATDNNNRRHGRVPQAANGAWPPVMRVACAAAYVDEISVETFRSRVRMGVYSKPVKFPGRGDVWLREELDADIDRLCNRFDKIRDAADVL